MFTPEDIAAMVEHDEKRQKMPYDRFVRIVNEIVSINLPEGVKVNGTALTRCYNEGKTVSQTVKVIKMDSEAYA